jgi:hypothetical protein
MELNNHKIKLFLPSLFKLTKKIDMQDLGKLVFESYIVQPKFHIGEVKNIKK